MKEERLEMSQKERDRLKVIHEVKEKHWKQAEAAERLGLSRRQVRRLLRRVKREGDSGIVHRLRGRESNRKIPPERQQRILAELRSDRYRVLVRRWRDGNGSRRYTSGDSAGRHSESW